MKKQIVIGLVILSTSFLLVGIEGCECIKNPVDDGVKPRASIAVVYKQGGQEIIKEFNSTMPQPSSLMGFEVFLPGCTPYSLVLTGGDGGGVSGMKLASVEFANTSNMPITKPYFMIFDQDFSKCIKKNRLDSRSVSHHNDKRIHYELTVTDISGAKSVVKIIVVPAHVSGGCGTPSCQQTGIVSKWLNWNQDLASPRWSGTLVNADIAQYCSGVKIKKASFDIFTDCDSITSLAWHVRIGTNQYDNLSDKDPNNPKHVRVEVDTLVPLAALPIEVWSDRFVLSDYTYPNCGTDHLPQIDIKLTIGQ